jgi:lipopolysaccharide transport system permease protein
MSPKPEPRELIIAPLRGWVPVNWGELSRYRELLYFLVWRDIKVRYKEAILGAAWAVLQPVMSMLIFTIIFGHFAGLKSRVAPELQDKYPVFIFAALVPWSFFANSVQLGGVSLINQGHILRKIYFPRLFVPAAVVGGYLVELAISFGILLVMMLVYRVIPTAAVLALPALILLTVINGLGIAFLLSAITVTYRDVRYLVPFMVQAWLFLTPVVYPVSIVSEEWRWLLALNPMFGVINSFRAALLGTEWHLGQLAVSATVGILLFTTGLFYFRRTERDFADIV